VGEIPAGLPRPSLPDFGTIDLAALIGAALGITVVGYTDNVLTTQSFATRAGNRIDSQQEFLALGAANLSAGVLHGFPVSSSGSRTAVGEPAAALSFIRWSRWPLCSLRSLHSGRFFPASPWLRWRPLWSSRPCC
jgi:sulfate permease, SulP family